MYFQKTCFSLFFAGFILISLHLDAQHVVLEHLTIYGLKRTKELTVFRELTFEVGDSLVQTDLGEIIERNKNNLLNMGIFNEVEINVSEWNTETHKIDIVVEVRESWYIYAVPILDIADRNINVWWTEHNHSLSRLNLGGRLDFLNFTGRNDKLKAQIQVGYTSKQEIEYRFPYFNKNQSLGLTMGFLHSGNKEVNYHTTFNKDLFVKIDERQLFEKYRGKVKIQYRPTLYLRQELELTYESMKVDEEVVRDYNPRYFRNGETKSSALIARYAYEYDDRDLRIFPTDGVKAVFEIEKIGWGKQDDENQLTSAISMEWNKSISNKFIHRISGIGRYSLSRSQPSYDRYSALGSGQKFVRGYELYVIDGLDFLLGKYQLSYKLLDTEIKFGRLVPIDEFRRLAVRMYLSLHLESGYVIDPFTTDTNPLANRWLWGSGAGLNVLLYNNFLIQFNMNRNDLGEWGFFIHNQTSF
ncbi:MAG: BamA/TamA family outer membrane protein [Bacteroidota bacterium]|nr:BamA/TamA family outer membrane protein [Bacteroidota bacterium]